MFYDRLEEEIRSEEEASDVFHLPWMAGCARKLDAQTDISDIQTDCVAPVLQVMSRRLNRLTTWHPGYHLFLRGGGLHFRRAPMMWLQILFVF